MKCATAQERIPAYVREGESTRALRRHVATCPTCGVESARYAALFEALGGLERATIEPPTGLWHSLATIPTRRGLFRDLASAAGGFGGHVVRNRRAYLGGAAVAVAAAALVRSRARRPATA